MKTLPLLAALLTSVGLAACGGGGDDATNPEDPAGGGGPVALTCSNLGGAVELPTSAQMTAYAATYNGDEGSYSDSGVFTKSGSASLVLKADGTLTYKAVAYAVSSVCIDKVAGPYGKILYVVAGPSGHFDIADTVDATLGQAWGVSPADGRTIFTKGLK